MTLHLPPLAAFRAFAAVARAGSFTAAAQALHVSTSAVSHQIRALEEALGAELLTRARNAAGPSRTAPTAAGEELLAAVESALALLNDACRAVHDRAHGARPALVVSANGSFASIWLAPRLAAFAGQHPSVSWHMRAIEDDQPDMLRENLDLSIIRLPQQALRAPDRLLFAETLFPVCSPALGFSGAPADLLRHNLLEEDHGGTPELNWRHWLAHLGLANPGQPAPRARIVRFSGFNQAIGAAIAGAGIALGRAPLVDADLAAGRLLRLFPPAEMAGSWVFALRARPGLARDPHVAHLRDYLLGEGHHHHP